jgi:hypothetical protein
MYNKCFNDLSLKAANEKRVWHEAAALELDKDAAGALQKLVSAPAEDKFASET